MSHAPTVCCGENLAGSDWIGQACGNGIAEAAQNARAEHGVQQVAQPLAPAHVAGNPNSFNGTSSGEWHVGPAASVKRRKSAITHSDVHVL